MSDELWNISIFLHRLSGSYNYVVIMITYKWAMITTMLLNYRYNYILGFFTQWIPVLL